MKTQEEIRSALTARPDVARLIEEVLTVSENQRPAVVGALVSFLEDRRTQREEKKTTI